MSDWNKIDSTAVEDYSPASTAVATFLRRNIGGLSTSRHMGAATAFDPGNAPRVSSGTNFRIEVPLIVPVEKWATTLNLNLRAEAHDGNVEVWLSVGDNIGSSSTFTGGDETLQVSCTLPSGLPSGWVKARLLIQSVASTLSVSGDVTREGGGEYITFRRSSGTWPLGSARSKIHAEVHLTNLSSTSPQRAEVYCGQLVDQVTTDVYQLGVWPYITGQDWNTDLISGVASKAMTADLYEMSSLEVFGWGLELSGSAYIATDRYVGPGAVIAAETVESWARDLELLWNERRHWVLCGFTPGAQGSGYSLPSIANGGFGGTLEGSVSGGAQTIIAMCPFDARDYITHIRVGILYTQVEEGTCKWRVEGDLGGHSLGFTSYVETGDGATPGTLTREYGAQTPGIWGCEDAIGESETSSLRLASFDIQIPAGVVVGDLDMLQIEIRESGSSTRRSAHVYAIGVTELLGGTP